MTANEMKFSLMLKFDGLFEFTSPEYDDRHISYILTEAERRVFMRKYNPLSDKFQSGFESNEQRRKELDQLIKSVRVLNGGKTENITVSGVNANLDTIYISGLDPVNTSCFEVGMKVYVQDDYAEVYTDGYAIVTEIVSDTTIKLDRFAQIRVSFGEIIPFQGAMDIKSCLANSSSQAGVHANGRFMDLPLDFLYAIEESALLDSATKNAWVKPVRYDEYLPNISNPYKKPYKNLVWRMDMSRQTQPVGDVTDKVEDYTLATRKRVELIMDPVSTLQYYEVRYLALPPAIVCDEFNPGSQRHCVLDESIHADIIDEAVVIIRAAIKPDEYQIALSEKQRSQ